MSLLNLISNFTSLPTLVWLFSVMFFDNAARGTHRRYVYRTMVRPLQWVALLNWVVEIPFNYGTGHPFWGTLDCFNLLWTAWHVHKFYASDEDDWWTKTGRKVKGWLRRTARSLVPKVRVPVMVGSR